MLVCGDRADGLEGDAWEYTCQTLYVSGEGEGTAWRTLLSHGVLEMSQDHLLQKDAEDNWGLWGNLQESTFVFIPCELQT